MGYTFIYGKYGVYNVVECTIGALAVLDSRLDRVRFGLSTPGSILYYTTLYYTILYYTILYYTILYYTGSCSFWGSWLSGPSLVETLAQGGAPACEDAATVLAQILQYHILRSESGASGSTVPHNHGAWLRGCTTKKASAVWTMVISRLAESRWTKYYWTINHHEIVRALRMTTVPLQPYSACICRLAEYCWTNCSWNYKLIMMVSELWKRPPYPFNLQPYSAFIWVIGARYMGAGRMNFAVASDSRGRCAGLHAVQYITNT